VDDDQPPDVTIDPLPEFVPRSFGVSWSGTCQATIRFTRRRQLEMPMAKPHDLDLVTG